MNKGSDYDIDKYEKQSKSDKSDEELDAEAKEMRLDNKGSNSLIEGLEKFLKQKENERNKTL